MAGNHDGKVTIGTALDNKGLEKGVNNISGSLGGLKSVVGKLGGIIAAAFSMRAIVNFSKAAIDLGSDLEEVQNVVDVSFGSMAGAAEDFASTAITKFGMSELAAKKTSSQYMAMAKGMGVAEGAASDMAISLAGLSGDAASFFNMDQEAVAKKLTGVFTGETEAMKELGVVMTQTNLKQYALQRGMNTNVESMSQAELVALRYAFVVDSLSLASGDFVRTQDSWANQTRILSMQWQQFMSIIGKTLTTILLPAVKTLNSLLSSVISMAQQLSKFVSGLFGVKQAGETASSAASSASASLGAAAGKAEDLENATKKAGKAAKSLAGFDQLNKLSDPGGSSSDNSGSTLAGSGAGSPGTVPIGGEVKDEVSPKIKAIADSIRNMFAPLKEIDLEPLKKSLKGLLGAISGFVEEVGKVFSWVWYNIMVPLATWVVEKRAPASVDALSAAFEGLKTTISVVFNAFQKCWDSLRPIFSWIGDTVLVVLEDLRDIGTGVAKKWEENSGKLEKTFENIGIVIEKVWVVVGPILTWIREALSTLAVGLPLNELQHIFDILFAISEILAGLVTGDFSKVLNGFGAAIAAETEYAESQIKLFAKSLGVDLDKVDQWVEKTAENIGQWFSDAWDEITEIWADVANWFNETVIVPLQEFWAPIGEWFSELFGGVEQTIKDVFHNAGVIAKGCWDVIKSVFAPVCSWFDTHFIEPLRSFFGDLWNGFLEKARAAWEGVKTVFSKVASFFSDTFKKAWEGIVKVFSIAGDIFNDIKDGVLTAFKSVVNGLIKGLNNAIAVPFKGINTALEKIKNIKIAGIEPFSGIKTISVPKIPYLARGAVLPPNKPFMAVVGDQRHGTNVEAPLATIQEAVALVMQDQTRAILAGFEASVGVQREILEAVLGIQIGDDVIGNAVARYSRKQAIIQGGAL